MLPLVREAIEMFRIYKACRFKEGLPGKHGPNGSGMNRQDFPYRVFPERKDMIA
jgi:hypothetical protein